MSLYTLTTTVYATGDFRCTSGRIRCRIHAISETNRHRRIHLHSTDLTTAIDTTVHRTITDDDSRIAIMITIGIVGFINTSTIDSHHGFLTSECGCFTLTTSEHITMISISNAIYTDGNTGSSWCNANIFYNIRCCRIIILFSTNIDLRATCDISQLTTTIDITSDVGTEDCLFWFIDISCCIVIRNRRQIDLCFRRNINRGITLDICCITTSKNITNSTKIGRFCTTRCSLNLVDIHNRVAIKCGTLSISASKHLTDTCTRNDVQHRIGIHLCRWVIRGGSIHCLSIR